MAVSYRVASRYAKSLLSLAEEKKMLETINDDMETFLGVCETSRDFVVMLESPILYIDQKKAVVKKIFEGKVSDLTLKFFEIIIAKNRSNALEGIAKEVVNEYNVRKGIQTAVVRTATPLSDSLKGEFSKIVGEALGKKIDLSESVEEDLIGGYILRVSDKQVDQSVKSGLNKLKRNFRSNK